MSGVHLTARLDFDMDAVFIHEGGNLFLSAGQRDDVRIE